jgi:hypothetical protein
MLNYFAEFRDMGDFWIRHNTHIYLDEFKGSQPAGQCLGVHGKTFSEDCDKTKN